MSIDISAHAGQFSGNVGNGIMALVLLGLAAASSLLIFAAVRLMGRQRPHAVRFTHRD